MNKRLRYNRTQLLDCISKLQNNSFAEKHEQLLNLLIKLQSDGLELDSKTILEFDMALLDELEEYIDHSYGSRAQTGNPIIDIINASEVKLGLHKLVPTVSCATDRDFF